MSRTTSSKTELGHASILINYLIPDLLADDRISSQKKEMYKLLQTGVHFSSLGPLLTAISLSELGFISKSNPTDFLGEKTAIFAVIDHSDNLKQFRHDLALFGKYKPAKAHNVMSFYTMRTFWLVRTSFFANIFSTGLTSLVEAGIYQRWEWNARVAQPRMTSYAAVLKIRKGSDPDKIVENVGDAEATTLTQVRIPFVIYLGMILGSIAVFLYEFRNILKAFVKAGVTRILQTFKSDSDIQSVTIIVER